MSYQREVLQKEGICGEDQNKQKRLYPNSLFYVIYFNGFNGFCSGTKKLTQEFDNLVSDNLTSYTAIQRNQIIDLIRDIENTLIAISRMVSSPLYLAKEEDMELFLEELGTENEIYQVDYLPMGKLQEGLAGRENQTNDMMVYEKVIRGERIISNIEYSNRLSGYYFAVVQPVVRNKETAGVLRVRVNAELFQLVFEKNSLYNTVYNCIIDETGNILYANAQGFHSTGNLYSSIVENGFSDETSERLKNMIKQNQEGTFQMTLGKNAYFVSTGDLEYNNWHIVNFLRSSDVTFRSDSIFKRMIFRSTFLILMTAAVSSMMVYSFIRQKKRLDFELRRYSILSQFSDTILFEYSYGTDSIEFTPNARKCLMMKDLKLDKISISQRTYTLLHPNDRPILLQIIRGFSQKSPKEEPFYYELRLKNLSGEYDWYGCQIRYIFEEDIPILIIGKLVDITDQRSREKELLKQAQKDVLTDTYNKSGEDLIEQMLKEKQKGILFMIDIDDFKSINDTFGHMAGDALLAEIGHMLNRVFRSSDIVARAGGDEFVVFIPHTSSQQLAQQRAQKIQEQLCCLKLVDYPDLHVSASIGIAVAPENGKDYAKLYMAADKAMYKIKCKNKDGYCFSNLK